MHFFCIFLPKNLVISKKSSTFAPAFEKKGSDDLTFRVKKIAEIAQLVEHDLAKVGVASSSLVFRSFFLPRWRNWYTRAFQVRMPRGVQVRVLFWARDAQVVKLVYTLL